jgi:hypothetical protein
MEQRIEYFLATGWIVSGRSKAVVTTINKVTTFNKPNGNGGKWWEMRFFPIRGEPKQQEHPRLSLYSIQHE